MSSSPAPMKIGFCNAICGCMCGTDCQSLVFKIKNIISLHYCHVFLSLSFISSYSLTFPLPSLSFLTSYSPHCNKLLFLFAASVWLYFVLFLLFSMHIFPCINFVIGPLSVVGCSESEWMWSWGRKFKAPLMAKSMAVEITARLSAVKARRPHLS